jgi:AcrR family transcriptional regulator
LKESILTEMIAEAGSLSRYSARKDEILVAATSVLNNFGSRGFSLAAVAKKMDLHPVSLTYYYRKRDDLLAAVMRSTVEHYDGLVAQAARFDRLEDRLTHLIAGHFEIQRRDRLGLGPPIGTFAELRLLAEPNRTIVLAAHQDMYNRFCALFETPDRPMGAIRRSTQTRLMIEHLGWSRTWLATLQPGDYPDAAAKMADVLIGGLASPGQAWPAVEPIELGEPVCEGDVSRKRFLIAATEMINRSGYYGASVEKISARLNVTKGSFYYHNADKDDLFAACVEYALDILRQGQNAPYPGNGFERLCASAMSLALYQASGARGRMLRSYALVSLAPEDRVPLQARYRQAAMRFAEMIRDGIDDGSIRPVDPTIAGLTLMAMVNSSAYLEMSAPGMNSSLLEAAYVRPSLTGLLSPTSGAD